MDMQSKEASVIVVPGNVPAFLLKLWNIVENPAYDPFISWNQNGKTIKIHDQNEFAKQILPKYYKHNNFSSFVRQVNMYGFRKIVDTVNVKQEYPEWEFYHQYFQQGSPEQLHMIKRKVHVKEDHKISSPQLSHVLLDVEKLKLQHSAVSDKLSLVKAENEMLWNQIADLRDQHKNQQNMIKKLVEFFLKLIIGKTDIGRKRKALDYPLRDSKVARSNNLQVYDPQAASMPQLLQEPYSNLDSPTENTRLIELPKDTIEVVDQSHITKGVENTLLTPISTNDILSIEPFPNNTSLPLQINNPSIRNSSLLRYAKTPSIYTQVVTSVNSIPQTVLSNSISKTTVKTNQEPRKEQQLPPRTIVTIIPNNQKVKVTKPQNTNANTKTMNANNASPFIFPTKFQEKPIQNDNIKKVEELSTPIIDFPDEIIAAEEEPTCETILDNCLATNTENVMDSNIAPSFCPECPPDTTALSTAPVPLYENQNSINARDDVSNDVEQISKSIELLQELLENQQINVDLKNINLNQIYGELASQLPIQDILKINQQNENEQKEKDNTHRTDVNDTEGQLIPYTQPFSPSQYLDPQSFEQSFEEILDGSN